MLFLVAFEVKNDSIREQMTEYMKKLGGWGRVMDGVYVVHTEEYGGKEIRNMLGTFMSPSDRLFVTDISDSSWWSCGIPVVVRDFLRKHS